MFGMKTIRVLRIERRRKKEGEQRQEEQKKIEEENYKKDLQRLGKKAPEYVLTISAPAYVDGVEKKLTDYTFRSISAKEGWGGKCYIWESALHRIVRKGEELGAEVVVDVKPSHYNEDHQLYLLGTALIPKKK